MTEELIAHKPLSKFVKGKYTYMYTDINKTCNILVTLRRVPATIVAVERQ
jgi:hypothetical protein